MQAVVLSASKLKQDIETKAYAYGVSSAVCTLLGEYVIELIKQAKLTQQTKHPYERKEIYPVA
jgi:hypothetical protein